jgi:hypothetical protein
MESSRASLRQPWKEWFVADNRLDVNPLDKPVSLGRARQGGLPPKPRQVDLSKDKKKSQTTVPYSK